MKKVKNIIKLILCLINIILSIVLLISLNSLNMIPNKYFSIIIIVLIVINILSMLFLLFKKLWLNIIGFIFSIILIIISIIGINITSDATEFINRVFNDNSKEIVEYDLVVMKKNGFNNIDDLKDKTVGIYNIDKSINEKVISKLDGIISMEKIEYTNFTLIKDDLYSNKVDSILVNSSTYELLCEVNENFSDNTKIIKKIFISLEKEKIKEEIKEEVKKLEPINVYISGIDTRGDLNKVSRSDVNIIMTINPNTYEVLLTTIPRDTYVQLSGTTGLKDKLTHAGIYGINMSKNTIQDFLNIKIDYYVRVNFDSVVAIVDEIGGIDLNNDVAFTRGSRYFATGIIHLNGKDALTYSRERKLMPDGDYTRGAHQQKVIEAIITKISNNKELLLDYEDIMDDMAEFFQTDINEDIFKFYVKNQIDKMPKWNINSISVECTGSNGETYSMPGWNLYIAIPNEESVNKASTLINGIIEGKTYTQLTQIN